VDFGQSFDAYYFGKSPFEDPQLYINKSPFFKMDKVQAPVLIFHGTADRNVPPAQSWSYFRALQHFDKTVTYVVFPGEPHGPRKLTHQMRKVEEEVAWFDKYFFKTAKLEDEAVKKDSPLSAALRAKGIARSPAGLGTIFTEKTKNLLLPEVVKHKGLEIGRFEVTRAQFKAMIFTLAPGEKRREDLPSEFLSQQEQKYPTGLETANYPAAVSLAEAQTFVLLLSKRTGQIWRLPFEDEVRELYENRENENTLDYWAGYAPNPEDTSKLRSKAAGELPGTAPLLKEVGSFAGKGKEDEEPIYDLGGNVAEWVLTRDGKGKIVGGSADCPADARANCTPAPEYVGFRVVRGAAKPAAANK
jgi:hypothetical protein